MSYRRSGMIVSVVVCSVVALLPTADLDASPIASFQGLGDLPGAGFNSGALGVSADGSVVVGWGSVIAGGFNSSEAFRWTADGGMVGLGGASGPLNGSRANATSADGSVVVGQQFGNQAFRWTADSGRVFLGGFIGGEVTNTATGVSADGAVVAVSKVSPTFSGPNKAFRWTSGSGMVGLGDLPGGNFQSAANATSADGSVIVGRGRSASMTEAMRWTVGGGMVGLGVLPGGTYSEASATSADGSVVVGLNKSVSGFEPFLWTGGDGIRSLQDVLATDLGLDLTGWQLREANGISADGLTIVGVGNNPGGFTEAWIATIPEPATLSLLAVGGLLGARRRR